MELENAGATVAGETQTATVADILHVDDITGVVLKDLSITDMLSLASTSSTCMSAVRPQLLEFNVANKTELRVLKVLKHFGCLQYLQQVTAHLRRLREGKHTTAVSRMVCSF